MLYEFLHNLNHITNVEYFYLTVAVSNYINPKLYTCRLCPADEALRARKGCRGEISQRVGSFRVDRCPGNHLKNIDFLLDFYVKWKRTGDFAEHPAKLIDSCHYIDNRIEKHKEFLQKEADRKQKTKGIMRGNHPRRNRKY